MMSQTLYAAAGSFETEKEAYELTVIRNRLKDYRLNEIYYVGETASFFNPLPIRTFVNGESKEHYELRHQRKRRTELQCTAVQMLMVVTEFLLKSLVLLHIFVRFKTDSHRTVTLVVKTPGLTTFYSTNSHTKYSRIQLIATNLNLLLYIGQCKFT